MFKMLLLQIRYTVIKTTDALNWTMLKLMIFGPPSINFLSISSPSVIYEEANIKCGRLNRWECHYAESLDWLRIGSVRWLKFNNYSWTECLILWAPKCFKVLIDTYITLS